MNKIKSPFTEGRTKEIGKIEAREFRKEFFNVPVRYYVCEDTGESYSTAAQDELTLNELYSQYRALHGIPFTDEIRAIRQLYGLTLQQMTNILGFGPNQYAKYERGQIPSISNGKLISAILYKDTMVRVLESSREEFSKEEYQKLYQLINSAVFPSEKKDTHYLS